MSCGKVLNSDILPHTDRPIACAHTITESVPKQQTKCGLVSKLTPIQGAVLNVYQNKIKKKKKLFMNCPKLC